MFSGKYYLEDGTLYPREKFTGIEANSVYEVLRVIEGKPLFWAGHFKRLIQSMALNQWLISVSEHELLHQIQQLVQANQLPFANLRINITPANKGKHHIQILQSPTLIPEKSLYKEGVKATWLTLERPDPNSKNVLPDIKAQVSAKIEAENVWETLLVNAKGEITEGSRTNVFFVKGNEWITPPIKQILPGITRAHIIDLCKKQSFEVHERVVALREISAFDGLVFTGTTPGIIPAQSVDQNHFNPKLSAIQTLIKTYQTEVQNNIEAFSYPPHSPNTL